MVQYKTTFKGIRVRDDPGSDYRENLVFREYYDKDEVKKDYRCERIIIMIMVFFRVSKQILSWIYNGFDKSFYRLTPKRELQVRSMQHIVLRDLECARASFSVS